MTGLQLKQMFPESRWPAIQRAFDRTFRNDLPQKAELLTGGLSTSLLYKITVKDKDYVLRVIMCVDELNNPSRQFQCMKIAAEHGIAPFVFYTDENDAISITEFIEAIPIRAGFSTHEELLRNLVKTIRSIHQLPEFPSLIGFLDGVDLFITQYKILSMFPVNVFEECFVLYEKLQKVYPRNDASVVSSHNDLNPNNLLFDGKKIWVIDWEAAFRNDKYVDLAIVSKSFVQNRSQEECFLKAYFGTELDNYKRARFFLMTQICLMYYAMVMLKLAATAKPKDFTHCDDTDLPGIRDFHLMVGNHKISLQDYESKLMYGKILLNTMLGNMKTRRFNDALELVAIQRDTPSA